MRKAVIKEIRERLLRFTNCRERAYKEILKQGHQVPALALKKAAIEKIRLHLQASECWGLRGHINLVLALRTDIKILLPYDQHPNSRIRAYRRHVIQVITWCEDHVPGKQTRIFQPNAA